MKPLLSDAPRDGFRQARKLRIVCADAAHVDLLDPVASTAESRKRLSEPSIIASQLPRLTMTTHIEPPRAHTNMCAASPMAVRASCPRETVLEDRIPSIVCAAARTQICDFRTPL